MALAHVGHTDVLAEYARAFATSAWGPGPRAKRITTRRLVGRVAGEWVGVQPQDHKAAAEAQLAGAGYACYWRRAHIRRQRSCTTFATPRLTTDKPVDVTSPTAQRGVRLHHERIALVYARDGAAVVRDVAEGRLDRFQAARQPLHSGSCRPAKIV